MCVCAFVGAFTRPEIHADLVGPDESTQELTEAQYRKQHAKAIGRARRPRREGINLRDSQRQATKPIKVAPIRSHRGAAPASAPAPAQLPAMPRDNDESGGECADGSELLPVHERSDDDDDDFSDEKTDQEETLDDCLNWRVLFPHLRYARDAVRSLRSQLSFIVCVWFECILLRFVCRAQRVGQDRDQSICIK